MNVFSNWAGNVQFRPRTFCSPDSLEAIAAAVQQAQQDSRRVRVVASGHSWMPLIETRDLLMSLEQWQGVERVDHEKGTAVIRAGTTLARAGQELFEQGVALQNMGDIDVQTIAGAFFTGTHGTGVELPILSASLVGVTIVTADGRLIEWNESDHPDEMNAVRVSFGAFGVVAKMEVRVEPAYKLLEQQCRMPLRDVIDEIETLKQANRNVEFFWFPYTDWAMVKRLNKTDRPIKKPNNYLALLEDRVAVQFCEWGARYPKLGAPLNRTLMRLANDEPTDVVDQSHIVYPSPRTRLRFYEMEYNIPADHWRPCFEALLALYDQPAFNIALPVECRWVKADDSWLSPAYRRDSAYIAVHQAVGAPYQAQFAKLEAMFRHFGGRPHWGKLNTMSREQAWKTYPKMRDFAALRDQIDPDERFCNDYLARMLA